MHQLPYMRYLVPALTLTLIVASGMGAYYYYKQAQSIEGFTTIDIQGKGEVKVVPDIASFSFTVMVDKPTQAEAQSASADASNKILSYLKEQGIEEKDIQTTNYSLSPKYEWRTDDKEHFPNGNQVLTGYTASQQVTVKVRDTAKAGTLLGAVGERGATNISGLSFTTEDTETLKAQAIGAAIKDAQAKAQLRAKQLGVHLGKIQYVNEGGPVTAFGGDQARPVSFEAKAMSIAPEIPAGENTYTAYINIGYRIK